jgi:hypothetical protein
MGERYKDVEESSVRVCAIIQSRQLLMHDDMVATKTCPKFLAILMERPKHLSSCWQVVHTGIIFCSAHADLAITRQCSAAILLRL